MAEPLQFAGPLLSLWQQGAARGRSTINPQEYELRKEQIAATREARQAAAEDRQARTRLMSESQFAEQEAKDRDAAMKAAGAAAYSYSSWLDQMEMTGQQVTPDMRKEKVRQVGEVMQSGLDRFYPGVTQRLGLTPGSLTEDLLLQWGGDTRAKRTSEVLTAKQKAAVEGGGYFAPMRYLNREKGTIEYLFPTRGGQMEPTGFEAPSESTVVQTDQGPLKIPKAPGLVAEPIISGGKQAFAPPKQEFDKLTGTVANIPSVASGQPVTTERVTTPQGTVEAKEKAIRDLPEIVANADMMTRLATQLKSHPGMPDVVGMPAYGGITKVIGQGPVWNTDAADFETMREQLKGGAFLSAFDKLRGGGQITVVEGEKATQAIIRAQTAQTEQAFVQAMDDFIAIVENAKARAMNAARGEYQPVPLGGSFAPASAQPSAPTGTELRPGEVEITLPNGKRKVFGSKEMADAFKKRFGLP